MKRKLFKLTPEIVQMWKEEVVAYLRTLYPKFPGELGATLMAPDVLDPQYKYRGDLLLQPGMKMSNAYYLRKGLVKMYTIDPVTGIQKIFYIWEAGSIVVLYKAFRERLAIQDFYIELMEDAELVAISNFSMNDIYEEHTAAHELTQKILSLKTERRMLQTDILTMVDKKRRYCMFKKKFPGLFVGKECRLLNEEICGFINISESLLRAAKGDCAD